MFQQDFKKMEDLEKCTVRRCSWCGNWKAEKDMVSSAHEGKLFGRLMCVHCYYEIRKVRNNREDCLALINWLARGIPGIEIRVPND